MAEECHTSDYLRIKGKKKSSVTNDAVEKLLFIKVMEYVHMCNSDSFP
jgi:hypothetical protein